MRKVRSAALILALTAAPAFGLIAAATVQEGRAETLEAIEKPLPPGAQDEITRFCTNVTDAARDRRYAMQAEELKRLEAEIDSRIEALEAKRREYEDWLARRQQFIDMAKEDLVAIYAKMRPDAAAERMSELDGELAAAILMKLDARQAGVILNEMEKKVAAALTSIIASAARKEDPS